MEYPCPGGDRLSSRPSLFRSTVMLTAVGLASQLLSFLYRVVMARLAGAQVLGLYQLIMPAYAVMQSLSIAGLTVAVSVLTAEHQARRNETGVQQVLSTALRGLFVVWLPILLTVLVCSDFISTTLLGDSRTELGLVLLLPVLLLTGLENLQKQHFYALGRMALPAGVELGEQLVRCISIIALLAVLLPQQEGIAAALIVAGLLISEVFSSSLLTWQRRRRGKRQQPWAGQRLKSRELSRRICRIALPVSITALVGNLMGAATSVLIPKLLVDYGFTPEGAMEEFGVMLGMTLPLLMVPTCFINALTLSLLPRMTQERELGQLSRFRRTGEKAMLSVSYVVLPLITLVAALGPELGGLLFGDLRVGQHIVVLAVAVAAGCYRSVLVCMLNALGKQAQSAAISLFAGALELVLTAALVGRFGLGGFGVAMVVSELVGAGLCLALVWRSVGVAVDCFRCFTAPILASLLAGLLVNLVYRMGLDRGISPLFGVCGGLCFGLALYLAAMLAQGIHPVGAVLGKSVAFSPGLGYHKLGE